MFNKKTVKSVASALMASVMLFSTTALASKDKKTVTAVYNDIKIAVDGYRVVPRDVNGNVVDPFIIDGTTYLPVRALANALGQGVKWDSETSTVIIGGTPDNSSASPSLTQSTGKGHQSVEVTTVYNDIKIVVNGNAITPTDVNGNIVEPFIIDGTTYLPVRALANALGEEVSWEQSTSTVYIGIQPFRADASILKRFTDTTLATVGDTPLKGSYYNILVAQNCNDASFPMICDNYASGKTLQELSMNGVAMPQVLSDFITESLVPVAAVYDYANKNGFLAKEEVQKALDAYVESYYKQYKSDAEFFAFLEQCGITEQDYSDFIRFTTVYSLFADDLYGRYSSIPYADDEFASLCKDKYITAKHILVEDAETAKNIIKKLGSGTSFDALSDEYNLDPGASASGYTFTTGEMVPEFEEAAFALKENTYTQTPVKSDYGYHVIMRMPLDTAWIEGNKGTVISTLAANDTNAVINEIIAQTKVALTNDYNTYFSTIK